MIEDKLEVKTDDSGNIIGIDHEVKMNTMGVREFAMMVRNANKARPKSDFMREVRVVGVIPFILPDGSFKQNEHALNIDNDQLDFLLKQCPDFDVDPKATDSIKV